MSSTSKAQKFQRTMQKLTVLDNTETLFESILYFLNQELLYSWTPGPPGGEKSNLRCGGCNL